MSSLSIHGICKVTRDPEFFKSKYGNWLHFTVASFRKFAKAGKQEADLFEVNYFLKNPDSKILKSLRKNRLIYLDRAELRNDKFTGRDGREKSSWKIMLLSFDFVDAPPKGEAEPNLKDSNKLDAKDIIVPEFDNDEPPF